MLPADFASRICRNTTDEIAVTTCREAVENAPSLLMRGVVGVKIFRRQQHSFRGFRNNGLDAARFVRAAGFVANEQDGRGIRSAYVEDADVHVRPSRNSQWRQPEKSVAADLPLTCQRREDVAQPTADNNDYRGRFLAMSSG